jgi:hypothetical protein
MRNAKIDASEALERISVGLIRLLVSVEEMEDMVRKKGGTGRHGGL